MTSEFPHLLEMSLQGRVGAPLGDGDACAAQAVAQGVAAQQPDVEREHVGRRLGRGA